MLLEDAIPKNWKLESSRTHFVDDANFEIKFRIFYIPIMEYYYGCRARQSELIALNITFNVIRKLQLLQHCKSIMSQYFYKE